MRQNTQNMMMYLLIFNIKTVKETMPKVLTFLHSNTYYLAGSWSNFTWRCHYNWYVKNVWPP